MPNVVNQYNLATINLVLVTFTTLLRSQQASYPSKCNHFELQTIFTLNFNRTILILNSKLVFVIQIDLELKLLLNFQHNCSVHI